MKTLKISLSGIRGVAGKSLTSEVVRRFAFAFAGLLGGGRVAVATDGRSSSEMCFEAVCRGLSAGGSEPVGIGISPTPTLQMSVRLLGAAGGICITASHNPTEWNGLKLYSPEGILLDEAAMGKVIALFEKARIEEQGSFRLPAISDASGKARKFHMESVLSRLDAPLIRKKGFKVAIDAANGAGANLNRLFLSELGCEPVELNSDITGQFSRPPEPLPRNLGSLSRAVVLAGADAGFAQDPDADRLALVDEAGRLPGEDYTLALAVSHILSRAPGPVVVNLSTTMAVDEICARFGASLVRTRIGERNVIAGMKKHEAVIGGEGNGGVIYPAVHYGRDSFAGMGLVLQAMAETGKPLSALLGELPEYHIIKEKVRLDEIIPMDEIKNIPLFSGTSVDVSDGVRASWSDSWVHIRGSNTEPAVRVIAESKDEKSARSLYAKVVSEISV